MNKEIEDLRAWVREEVKAIREEVTRTLEQQNYMVGGHNKLVARVGNIEYHISWRVGNG